MKYKRISDFPKSQAESISVLGVEDGHNVQIEVLSKNATLQNIQEGVANKANKDGDYPKMTAGFAQEIVGDGSATPEEFSFRPTAGEDRNVANTTYYDGERNGVARIERIKGNSIVHNQLLKCAADQSGVDGWWNRVRVESPGFPTITIEGSTIFQPIKEQTANNQLSQKCTIIKDHKYLIHFWYDNNGVLNDKWGRAYKVMFSSDLYGSNFKNFYAPQNYINSDEVYSFVTAEENWSYFIIKQTYIDDDIKPTTMVWKDIWLIDLTKEFGSGNEPTTKEEFWQKVVVGKNLNERNTGEIIDGNYGAIKTVGFNAFNGTYAKVCAGCSYYLGGNYTSLGFTTEEGGTLEAITIPTSAESVGTTPSDRLYTPSQNGYIYAEGTNININISWGTEYGYLNGTLQPYKPFTRDLSWLSKYFPNGMRSAGSARDEIRFNSTTQKWEAVQNVGVVDLGSLRYTAISERTNTYRAIGNIPLKKYVVDLFPIHIVSTYNTGLGDYYWTNDEVGVCDLVNPNTRGIVVGVAKKGVSGTSESIATALQGVMLNYALATPIVTEISEDVNLDFDVSDYGTEELIVEDGVASAPLVADISYSPNALSTLKQVPDILKRLKALESAVASATATTNEETVE